MTGGLRDGSRSLAYVECRMKTVDKASALEVDRLVQEADRSAVQCACLNPLVGIGRYENNWYVKAEMRQMMLQFYSAHLRQLHIQYQPPRSPTHSRLKKSLGGSEGPGAKSNRPPKALKAPRNPSFSSYNDKDRGSNKSSFRHR